MAFSVHKRIEGMGQGAVLACPLSSVLALTLLFVPTATYSAPAPALDADGSAEKALNLPNGMDFIAHVSRNVPPYAQGCLAVQEREGLC